MAVVNIRYTDESVARADATRLPIRSGGVDCIVTSPPYWGLRRYGNDGQLEIGLEDLDVYLKKLLLVTDECWRILRDDGLFWLNIGDTASGSGGAGGDYNKGGSKAGKPKYKQGISGLPSTQWCMVPSRLAVALQAQGWLVRQWITWDKERLRAEDLRHARRPGVSSEVILMLAKHPKHRFFADRLAERGNVWRFPPRTEGPKHLAPFPAELVERCVLPSTEPGDLVFDPFLGSGTTVRAAIRHGRKGAGVDLYAGMTGEELGL